MRNILSTIIILALLSAPLLAISVVPHGESAPVYLESAASVFERGPTVNLVSNDSATIFWRTASPEDSAVFYGKNTSLLESVTSATTVVNHTITLSSLDINTKYYYKVKSGTLESEVYYFFTAPADGEEFRLVIAGDNRPSSSDAPNQPQMFSDIADLIIAKEPHLVVLTGDYVYEVTSSHENNLVAWKKFTDIIDRIGHYAPVIGAIGNHDTGTSSGAYQPRYYLDAFMNSGENKTYFSLDYAGTHLTFIDSEELGKEGHIQGTQYDWLVSDLTTASGEMKFVFAHRPLYPTSHIGSGLDINTTERNTLQQLFEEKNVTLFASGHDHAYSRVTVNGVVHIITGGLGAPPYDSPWSDPIYHFVLSTVSAHSVNFTVIKSDESVHAQYVLPYEGPMEIVDRIIANTSSKAIGTVPVILFSEKPVTKYFSWDGGPNTTEVTGLPGPEGEHTLDVYAEDSDGIWTSARFIFNTIIPNTFSPPDDTTPPILVFDPIVVLGLVGTVAIVVVLGVYILKKRR